MRATERATELKSLEEVKTLEGERWPSFFINFLSIFPGSNKGSLEDIRGILESKGVMDLPFSGFFSPKRHGEFSRKLLEGTPRDFFATIDRVTLDLGISPEKIISLKRLRTEARLENEKILYEEQLLELLAPVFFRLREMGYGYLDLITM